MKVFKSISSKIFLMVAVLSPFAVYAAAQCGYNRTHFGVAWQMNAPIDNDYADKISGWGMNFEINYDITSRWTAGLFANYHTNHKYVGRHTIYLDTEAFTSDQSRSAFQVPFGVNVAYKLWNNRIVKPYVGAKAGACFGRYTTYYGTGGSQDKEWGFYVSPEIGFKIYPCGGSRFGFQVAGYYSYSTNKMKSIEVGVDGLHNAGFRVGVLF